MKRPILILSIFVISLGFISCNNDDDNQYNPTPVIVTFNADLDGASEVPANASSATGSAVLTYNKSTKKITLTTTFSGLTVTDAHIHKGAVGVDGGVVFPISDISSPMYFTSVALNSTQEADLLANLYYINLHSSTYPGGEIRGQLITTDPGGSGGSGGGGGGGY